MTDAVDCAETLRLRIAQFDMILAMFKEDKYLMEMIKGYVEALP